MQNLEEWRTKLGALLESIVGLSVQICKSIQASGFADALRNENLEVDVFMQKLKRILDLYKSPDTEFPGIRRVTVELIIWMVQSSSSYLEVFFQHQVDKAVKEVAETETRLEMFEMFCCGIGVVKHGYSISSLVASAAFARGRTAGSQYCWSHVTRPKCPLSIQYQFLSCRHPLLSPNMHDMLPI